MLADSNGLATARAHETAHNGANIQSTSRTPEQLATGRQHVGLARVAQQPGRNATPGEIQHTLTAPVASLAAIAAPNQYEVMLATMLSALPPLTYCSLLP